MQRGVEPGSCQAERDGDGGSIDVMFRCLLCRIEPYQRRGVGGRQVLSLRGGDRLGDEALLQREKAA